MPIIKATLLGGFYYWQRMRYDSNNLNAIPRWGVARRQLDGGETTIFAKGEKAVKSLIH